MAARPPDPGAVALAQRPGYAMDEPNARALAAIVQQAGHQKIGVGRVGRAQGRHDVKTVAPIGHQHGIEQGQLRRRQPARQLCPLFGRHAGVEIGPSSVELGRPPTRCQRPQLSSSGTPIRKLTTGTRMGTMIRPANRTTRIRRISPYWFMKLRRSCAVLGSRKSNRTCEPSRGVIGIRLNRRSTMFNSMPFKQTSATISRAEALSGQAPYAYRTRKPMAKTTARARFESGPATATIESA